MLLSRVAESVYWTGRYLERAEATARILRVHTEQYLDLPRAAGLGWVPLLAVTGSADAFTELHDRPSEEQVVAFLAAERRNASSIVSSLELARQNVRATRTVFPREAWEALNRLYLDATEGADDVVIRTRRRPWTVEVIAGCQRFGGIIASNMSHDAAYSFLRIGSQIERADMTTRVLDVRAGTLLLGPAGHLRPYADLSWMSVLKSLSAYQMYRRTGMSAVEGRDIVRFLLQDAQFPRSVEHCLVEIGRCLLELPRHEVAMKVCAATVDALDRDDVAGLARAGLHEYVDELQLRLIDLHEAMGATYFPRAETADGEIGQTQLATAQPPLSREMVTTA